MINGLDERAHAPIAFVDCDGVIFEEGTDRLAPGAAEALRWLSQTHRIVLFTCRDAGSWIEVLRPLGIPFMGYMPKPLACSYCYIDDRLDLSRCANDLSNLPNAPICNAPVWQEREDEEKELENAGQRINTSNHS